MNRMPKSALGADLVPVTPSINWRMNIKRKSTAKGASMRFSHFEATSSS
jgi:hypothetical protein